MEGIINTIKQNCRRCYTCVRDCPAKAIRIEDGQASVVAERCISCGNCTMVCSQDAKAYKSGIEGHLYAPAPRHCRRASRPVVPRRLLACPPPKSSAPCASWASPTWSKWPTAPTWSIRPATTTCREHPTGIHIASACPAVVEYVRKYHPELTDSHHAHRLPHGGHRPRRQAALRTARPLRVHRPLRGQEGGDPRPEIVGVVDEVLTLVELERVLVARRRRSCPGPGQ